ncbi:hypothetical protein [Allokutzneria sp. NRRL B-24872]|uniref:hypothetical protein n=1 Tax=Allokutzneria sp. NRRL B-24872 TaxID=1137961 RepID=UPI000A367311|nr:hypothetical protein [Allokutzneria sp. NRRL B-24872]
MFPRLSARTRKLTLTVHIAAAGAWLGMDVVLGVLVVTALTADPFGSGAAAASIATFATWPLAVVGVLTFLSGVVLGLGSKYGLVRYWWVAVKLVLNVVLVVLVLFLLGPGATELAALARTGSLPDMSSMLFPPLVSSTVVLVAIVLSVFKPRGRVRTMTAVTTAAAKGIR